MMTEIVETCVARVNANKSCLVIKTVFGGVKVLVFWAWVSLAYCGSILKGNTGVLSAAFLLLELWVWIPQGAWISCVVRKRSLRRADHSIRGVLPSAMCQRMIVKPQSWIGSGPIGGCCAFEEKFLVVDLGRDLDKVKCKSFTEVKELPIMNVFNSEDPTSVTVQSSSAGNPSQRRVDHSLLLLLLLL
jgi:hypothetical protein